VFELQKADLERLLGEALNPEGESCDECMSNTRDSITDALSVLERLKCPECGGLGYRLGLKCPKCGRRFQEPSAKKPRKIEFLGDGPSAVNMHKTYVGLSKKDRDKDGTAEEPEKEGE